MEEVELKPCPFCGSDNVTLDEVGDAQAMCGPAYQVHCPDCNAYGPFGRYPDAVDGWNDCDGRGEPR